MYIYNKKTFYGECRKYCSLSVACFMDKATQTAAPCVVQCEPK